MPTNINNALEFDAVVNDAQFTAANQRMQDNIRNTANVAATESGKIDSAFIEAGAGAGKAMSDFALKSAAQMKETITAQIGEVRRLEMELERLKVVQSTTTRSQDLSKVNLAVGSTGRSLIDEKSNLVEMQSLYAAKSTADKEALSNQDKRIAGNAKEAESHRGLISTLRAWMTAVFAIGMVAGFVNQIIKIRGEFQQLAISFETLLGSKIKADALMAQVLDLSSKTPFQILDIATGAKQLLAYGFAAQDVIKDLKMIGDVAAGVGKPIGDIVYLYGTTLTQGRLYSRDVLQFTTRGVPILQELAKVLGVNVNQVQKLVIAGKIGFPEVQKAFESMTGSGGKFNNLTEKLTGSVTGQMSNLKDAYTKMVNNIGESNQGVIYSGISGIKFLIQNYQSVVTVLGTLVGVYGSYKAAVMVTNLVNAEQIALETAKKVAIEGTTVATEASNTAMKANAVGILVAGLALAGAAIYQMATHQTDLQKALTKTSVEIENEKDKVYSLFASLKLAAAGSKEYENAKKAIIGAYGDYFPAQILELKNLDNIKKAQDMVTEAITRNIAARIEQEAVTSINAKYNEQIQPELQSAIESIKKEAGGENAGFATARLSTWIEKVKQGDITVSQFYDAWNALLKSFGMNINTQGGANMYLTGITTNLRRIQEETKNTTAGFAKFDKILVDLAKAAKIEMSNPRQMLIDAREALVGTEKTLAELRSGKKKTPDVIAAIDAAQADADAQKALITKLTGETAAQQKRIDDTKQKALEASNKALEALETKHLANLEEFENYRNGITSQAIANMTDGIAKEKMLSELQYTNRIKAIDKEKDAILKQLNQRQQENNKAKGIKGGTPITSLTGQELTDDMQKRVNATQELTARNVKIESDSAKKIADLWEQVDSGRIDGLESISRKYDKLRKDNAESIAKDPGLGLALADNQAREVEEIRMKYKLQSIDTQEQLDIAIANATIKNKTELEQKLFDIWKKAQEDRAAYLSKGTPEEKKQSKAITENVKGETIKFDFDKLEKEIQKFTDYAVLAGNSLTAIFDSFGNEKLSSDISDVTGLVSAAGQTGIGVAKIMSGDLIGGFKDAVTGISNFIVGLNKMNDKKYENDIIALQKQVDALKIAYDDLGKSIEKAYSNSKANLIAQETENLKKQNELIAKQRADEENKKKKDQGKIDAYDAATKANNQTIEDNKQAAIDAINGTDISTAIDDFANAYADAWSAGTDAAVASTTLVASLIRTAIIGMLKDKLSPEVKLFMDELSKDIANGVIDAEEQARLDALTAGMTSTSNQFLGTTGNLIKPALGTAASSTLAGAIQSQITESTAGELAGLFRKQSDDTRKLVDWSSVATLHFQNIEINTYNTSVNTLNTVKSIDNSLTILAKISQNTGQPSLRGF
jgi:tape measure domain-containing protein